MSTLDAYRLRYRSEAAPLTKAEAAELREPVLERTRGGEVTNDERIEALSWLAYERCGHGTSAPAAAVDAILAELTEEPTAAAAPAEAAAEPTPAEPAKEE